MKVGDQVEINLFGDWLAAKVIAAQKDGTFKVKVDAPEHFCHERELIADSEHLREIPEKPVDTKSATVLNDAPNGHTFHS
jgi:hypothetical protein